MKNLKKEIDKQSTENNECSEDSNVYSEYIAENLDQSIAYSEYIAENLTTIDYDDSYPLRKIRMKKINRIIGEKLDNKKKKRISNIVRFFKKRRS